jgi:hypothetical protein
MNRTPYRLAVLAAIAAAIVAAGSTALSQTAIAPDLGEGSYGLWRDQDGGLWCGGVCSPGQACCSIHRP